MNYLRKVRIAASFAVGIAVVTPTAIVVTTTPAAAVTCSQRAANCVKNGGGSNDCYGRVASCQRSCVYVGPSGRSWSASGDCGGTKVFGYKKEKK